MSICDFESKLWAFRYPNLVIQFRDMYLEVGYNFMEITSTFKSIVVCMILNLFCPY